MKIKQGSRVKYKSWGTGTVHCMSCRHCNSDWFAVKFNKPNPALHNGNNHCDNIPKNSLPQFYYAMPSQVSPVSELDNILFDKDEKLDIWLESREEE